MSDLLHDRADRTDIRFSDLVQADVICCLAASRDRASYGWYPRSLVYAGELGKLELFARATNEVGFQPLKTLLRFNTAQEMIEFICSEQMMRIWRGERTFRSVYIEELFNLDLLRRRWSAG
jgi:Arc/MetJ family transcription regulator